MIKNAIVVMFDSLQFNYLGCYGNSWIKTPNMDRFAREGVLFENCYTEGLPTVPCRRAMHTGRFTLPYQGWTAMTMEDTSIADLCWGRPIDTALIFDCPMYRLPKFGYTRSFDKVWFTHGHEGDQYYYENDPLIHLNPKDYMDEATDKAYRADVGEQGADTNLHELAAYLRQRQVNGHLEENRYVAKTINKAIEYLEQVDRQKQFYLWIDSFDPHEPWDPPSVYNPDIPSSQYDPDYKGKDEFLPIMVNVDGFYTEAQLHHIRMLYAELVTLCDKYFGKLLDAIDKLGLNQNTLVMMVSDHGEPMGNGEHGHGIMRKVRPWPYEELVHTPLLARFPGCKVGHKAKGFVQSCDVAPTVCDWLGIGVHPDMQGKSLLKMMTGEEEKVRDFAIAGYHKYSWAIYTEDYSYVHWVKADKPNDLGMVIDIVAGGVGATSDYLVGVGGKLMSDMLDGVADEDQKAASKDAQTRHKEAATLDGEDQWTCTPGAVAALPEKDELYNRNTAPFQLNNIIDENPEVAKQMWDQLREFMTELTVMG